MQDFLLLSNFLSSNDAFLSGEVFTPVCLPHFQRAAFLHSYITSLDPVMGVTLALLSGSSDSFFSEPRGL